MGKDYKIIDFNLLSDYHKGMIKRMYNLYCKNKEKDSKKLSWNSWLKKQGYLLK